MNSKNKNLKSIKWGIIFFLLVSTLQGEKVLAQIPFTVEDVRIEGLEGVSVGTVFSYLPVKIGDVITQAETGKIIKALFKTKFFQNIIINSDGNTLVITVTERPSIAKIEFEGNEVIETEELNEALKKVDFSEGRIFNRSLFEETKSQLKRSYISQGHYSIEIESIVTPIERNRVSIVFNINEGKIARVENINIVGNTAFDDDELLDTFEINSQGFFKWNWLTENDRYSRAKLAADIERLKSYYLDNGYINFSVDSTQVSLTPDRLNVYITINITEGHKYTIDGIKLAGELILEPEELFPSVNIQKGEIFSRQKLTQTTEQLSERLGDNGYASANVNAVPDVDDDAKEVDVTFFIEPGQRIYVRRIIFKGNTRTDDEVLRREMRQLEGTWVSTSDLRRSQERLQKLGFFETVDVATSTVPGTSDQVDVVVTVAEQLSGNLLLGAGFSQTQGFVVNANITQENFLGSGKRVSAAFNNSSVNREFSLGYLDPYYATEGVSLGIDLSYKETDASNANVANYTTDILRGAITTGFPIEEFARLRFTFATQSTGFSALAGSSAEVLNFQNESGGNYNTFHFITRLAYDSRNARFLPDRGSLTSINTDIAIPGSGLTFYKTTIRHQRFFPITRLVTFIVDGELGFGDGYGNTEDLPLTENFLAGGIRSIRGFEANTLGPRDSNNEPLGGNWKTSIRNEMILPIPFFKDKRSLRLTGFFDAGNVFFNEVELGDLRYSTGLSSIWISPLGVFTISLAQPLNKEDTDEIQRFQFTFGTSF